MLFKNEHLRGNSSYELIGPASQSVMSETHRLLNVIHALLYLVISD